MEQRRKQYANEIRINISRLENAQKRDEVTLKNLPGLKLAQDIFLKKQSELQTALEKRKAELTTLQQREQDYLSGDLDSEISTEMQKNASAAKVRAEVAAKKKKDSNRFEDEKKVREVEYKHRSDERNLQKDFGYYYRVYCKANETLPDYMRENLADMPNNKGYIWRDCWFMGEKPLEEGQPSIMFEKKKGGIMHIHEIDQYSHKIYEKNGKEKKRLISSMVRKPKTHKQLHIK